MNRNFSKLLRLVVGTLCLALTLHAQKPTPVDTVYLNDKAKSVKSGKVTNVDKSQIRMEVPLAAGGPGAKMSVSIPRAQIERIEFAESESREELLNDPDLADIPEISVLWRAWEPLLDLPESPAPRIGNIYGLLLLQSGDASRAAEALKVFTSIEAKGWDDGESKSVARQGRLRAMVATGNAAAAVSEAEQLALESEDPEVLIEAKFILAEAAKAALVKLQTDNPRWTEDINVRPERERLYHEALELYLYPYLFYGSEVSTASRGLWGVISVHQFNNDIPAAIEASRDMVRLYPETPFGHKANEFLAALPEDQLKQDTENEAQYENAPDTQSKK